MYVSQNTLISDRKKGEKLRGWMKENGVTMYRLEKDSALSKNTISALYKGNRDGNIATWREIARALSCITGKRCTIGDIKE